MEIKTRFAPSPTGYLHIGSIRIALYAWLFAKKNNGKFILRIEDTYKSKHNEYYSYNIIKHLKWLGLNWDENIIYQSSRNKRYNEIIEYMLKKNIAYYCFCSKEKLNIIKKQQILDKKKPKYNNFCRNLPKNVIINNIKKNKSFVIRFKNFNCGITSFYDHIHGKINFNNNELDDLIIKKANGDFTYNFCSSIDDCDYKITHVIRGDDHISNTPRQINIIKSINFNVPEYIHIPVILDINKKKISKKNNLMSINEYNNLGLLPNSIIYYLSNIKDEKNSIKYISNIKNIINKFNLNEIKKSPITFDIKKLLYINKLFISKLDKKTLEKYLNIYIKEKNINISNLNISLLELIEIFNNRYNSFNDLLIKSKYLYNDINIKNIIYKDIDLKLIIIIKEFNNKIKNLLDWNKEIINKIIKDIVLNKEKKIIIDFYNLIRKIISGVDKTPGLSLIIYAVGKEKVINRINNFIKNF